MKTLIGPLLVLAAIGCQQQPLPVAARPCPAECDCERCKCKEPCSCGTDVVKVDTVAINAALDRLREDVNALRTGVARLEHHRPEVPVRSVRNDAPGESTDGYTGVVVNVRQVAETLVKRATCSACNQLVRDVERFGTGWRIGGRNDHFWVKSSPNLPEAPLLVAYRNGVELWREVGYDGDIDRLLRQHPKVEPRSLADGKFAVSSPPPVIYQSAPVVQYAAPTVTYSSPPVVYSAPVFSPPVMSWSTDLFGQPVYGYGQCINGVCP